MGAAIRQRLSQDITAAFHDHLALWRYGAEVRDTNLRKQFPRQRLTTAAAQGLPGPSAAQRRHTPRASHRRRGTRNRLPAPGSGPPGERPSVLSIIAPNLSSGTREIFEKSGIAVSDHVPVGAPVTGIIDDVPWRHKQIGIPEARPIAALLRTACFIVIAYLSGMRPGEVLNLQRGCVSRDPASGIWMIEGRKFKGAVDSKREKIPQGRSARTRGSSSKRQHARSRSSKTSTTNHCCFPTSSTLRHLRRSRSPPR